MLRRLIFITTVAVVAASVDAAAKAKWPTPAPLLHERSAMWLVGSCVLLPLCLTAIFVRSWLLNTAAALCAGGLAGNVASALTHRGRAVPNPFLLGGLHDGVAFNLADVFFIAGVFGVAAAAVRATHAARRPPTPTYPRP
jgi:lipoprotein signal peptidase